MSRRHNALISDGNSSTTPLVASGAEIIAFRAASGAGAGAATSLVITKPAGVVLDDVMVAQIAQGADAAPTFVAASSNNAGGGGSITVNKPAGTAQDDVMIAKISISNNVDANPPAGWTLIRDDGTGPRQKLFWKRAGASEPASYAFTTAGTSTRTITIVAYRGIVLTGDPIDAHGGQLGTTAATAPSITTTGFHRMLVACFSSDQPQATSSWTPPDGMTERSDEAIFINLEVISAETADQVVQQGATGTRTATQNGVSTKTIGALVALKPKTQTLQTITPPAGWTTIRTDDTNYRSSLYWKRAGSAEPADYTWTFGDAVDAAGIISAYDGVILTGDPIDVHGGTTQQDVVHTSVVAPSVTTTVANTMLLGFFNGRSNDNTVATWTPPVGMTQRKEQSDGTATVPISSEAASQFISAIGATGSRTATASRDLNNSVGNLVALKPEVAGSPIFIGIPEEVTDFSAVRIYLDTNQKTKEAGIQMQFSPDGNNFKATDFGQILAAGSGILPYSMLIPVRARFFRIQVENDTVAQGFMRLQVAFLPEADQTFPHAPDEYATERAENVVVSPGAFTTILNVTGGVGTAERYAELLAYGAHPTSSGAPVTFTNKYRVKMTAGGVNHTMEVSDPSNAWWQVPTGGVTGSGVTVQIQVRHDEAVDRNFDAQALFRRHPGTVA